MRCLQCGKDLPLLKRLAGGEFCSDVHRKEYQQEYTKLALSRLQQTVAPASPPRRIEELPKEAVVPAAVPASTVTPPVTAAVPALASAPKQETAVPSATTQPRRTPPIVPRPQSSPQPKAPLKRDTKPALAGTLTRKPPAAKTRESKAAISLEVVSARKLPALPHRQFSRVSTGLATANAVNWMPVSEVRGPATAVMESRMDVRGFVRVSPVMDVDMSVIPPRGWDFTRQVPQTSVPLVIPDAISPQEPVLWIAPPRQFSDSLKPSGAAKILTLFGGSRDS